MKSNIISVTVRRLEGLLAELAAPPVTVSSLAEADATLTKWAHTAPARGGYDKCSVRVVWANGEEYDTRYDLTHPSCKSNAPLAQHIETEIAFWSGTRCPDHLSKNKYTACIAVVRDDEKARLLGILENCKID